ncbi:MAG: hypothetical protein PHO66_00440, partial [Eubacteriales bacterium]|nr:hypothetical protein [Eubacteriales bacterium]
MHDPTRYDSQLRSQDGTPCLVLTYTDADDPRNNLQAWIAPGLGSNLFRFTYGGYALIDAGAAQLAKSGLPGTPVLYPTPNRVRDAQFTYRGRTYEQRKNGKPVLIHGLVMGEVWQYGNPFADDDGASACTWVDFTPDSTLYAAFPFDHRLALDFRLTAGGLSIAYRIENRDTREIPYGFGLHPFFSKLSGDTQTYISLPAAAVME